MRRGGSGIHMERKDRATNSYGMLSSLSDHLRLRAWRAAITRRSEYDSTWKHSFLGLSVLESCVGRFLLEGKRAEVREKREYLSQRAAKKEQAERAERAERV